MSSGMQQIVSALLKEGDWKETLTAGLGVRKRVCRRRVGKGERTW